MSKRLQLERDLYALLLELAGGDARRLEQVLAMLVEATNAQRAYLEIQSGEPGQNLDWSMSYGCDPEMEAEIRSVTSKGIVAEAIASGRTVHTPFAALDPRFSAQKSVRAQRLEAVLCVPLAGRQGSVLYLEAKRGGGAFADEDVQLVERLAQHLAAPVQRAVQAHRDREHSDPTAPFRQRLKLDSLAGRSAPLAKVFETVALAAPIDITVLISGPTGTGKTQVARAIHDNSSRHAGPFIELNCGAIPEQLLESELFGTAPGAFTGARRTAGKVEAAEGGTLFLDEIAEIPFAAQSKLLQLLQSRQYYPLGSSELATANIRVIAASNADLPALVEQKRFREDLYYRLNVVTLQVPALDERPEDLPMIIDSLAERLGAELSLPKRRVSDGFKAAAAQLEWKGNVRDLRNRVQLALIKAHAEQAAQVESRHLEGAAAANKEGPATFHEATRQFQKDLLARELKSEQWNVAATARRLDLSRSQMYNLMNSFGLTNRG